MTQTADTREGAYYVTVIDGDKSAKLLGPFINDHQAALDMVDAVMQKALELFPSPAQWAAFGTCRFPSDDSVVVRAGSFNKYFGLPH